MGRASVAHAPPASAPEAGPGRSRARRLACTSPSVRDIRNARATRAPLHSSKVIGCLQYRKPRRWTRSAHFSDRISRRPSPREAMVSGQCGDARAVAGIRLASMFTNRDASILTRNDPMFTLGICLQRCREEHSDDVPPRACDVRPRRNSCGRAFGKAGAPQRARPRSGSFRSRLRRCARTLPARRPAHVLAHRHPHRADDARMPLRRPIPSQGQASSRDDPPRCPAVSFAQQHTRPHHREARNCLGNTSQARCDTAAAPSQPSRQSRH